MLLDGKVALVTGGSRGLGKCMIEAFAAKGAQVVIASRKLAECQTLARQVRETYGRVDVNNAGMSPLYPSLDEVGEALWDKVIGVNLKGPFRLAAAIATRMAAGDGGSIINVSSIAAIRPEPSHLPYAAAKAGLNTLTEGFAQAFGPKVRVNTIQCGSFRTDISRAWTAEVAAELAAGAALGRIGEPEEVVGAALYLASDASSFCTGATLRLDGGVA